VLKYAKHGLTPFSGENVGLQDLTPQVFGQLNCYTGSIAGDVYIVDYEDYH